MDYEVESVRSTGRQRKLEVRLQKKTVTPNKYARKMLWIAGNEQS